MTYLKRYKSSPARKETLRLYTRTSGFKAAVARYAAKKSEAVSKQLDKNITPELREYSRYATRRARAKALGITEDDYNRISLEQNDKCAICRGPPTREMFAMDHDHGTGKMRGLLCTNCNSGIGNLHDSIPLLEAAIAYLKKHEQVVNDTRPTDTTVEAQSNVETR